MPYKIHTVLTGNSAHFTALGNTSPAAPEIKEAMTHGELKRMRPEDISAQNDIDHRLIKPRGRVDSAWAPRRHLCSLIGNLLRANKPHILATL